MRLGTLEQVGAGIAAVFALQAAPALAGPLDPGATLCLYPVQLPIRDAGDDPRSAVLQGKLIEALEAADFRIPDPDAVQAVASRAAEEAEGSIDPYTGRRDEARHRRERARFSRALHAELGCEARMLAQVRPVWSFFNGGFARWDGRSVQVSSAGRLLLQALGGANEFGHVRALSLWLRVFGQDGRQIAFRSGGIETLVRFAVQKDRDLLPEDQWLTDASGLDGAIALALGPGGEGLRRAGDPHRSGTGR